MKRKRSFWLLALVPVALLVWAMQSAASWRPRLIGVQPGANFITASPDGKLLVAGNSEVTQIWDVITQRVLWKKEGGWPIFSPDSRTIMLAHATSITTGEMRTFAGFRFELRDAQTGRLLRTFSDPDAKRKTDWGGDLCDRAFSPDGREFRVATTLWHWRFDVPSARLVTARQWHCAPNKLPDDGTGLGTAAFAADGTVVGWYEGDGDSATQCKDRCVNLALFDPRTMRQLRVIRHQFSGTDLQIAPDNLSFIETARGDEDENYLCRLQDGKRIARLPYGTAQFSADGKRLYHASEQGCIVFDARTGLKLSALPGPTSENFAPSPDENYLYEARAGKIYRWRAR